MPKTKISEFSATPANNTDIDSINIAEGCAPSGINDAIRELMAQLKDFQTGAQGDSFGGPINGTIGATTPNTGAFTTLTTTGTINLLTVGRGAGAVSTNTAVGTSALRDNTTGESNTAIGFQALRGTTTGTQNTASGVEALVSTTTGSNNTAVGYKASYTNTTGANNTALGLEALRSNTTASNNTAVGYQASYTNTTGSSNVALGGAALYSNTTGPDNVSVGNASLYANTTGAYNTAIGRSALQSNTTASNNTAVGYQALYANTTGTAQVAVGNLALDACTTGSRNTAIGDNALGAMTTADNNTAVGRSAGLGLTTGVNNTFVGAYNGSNGGSGAEITTGSKNTILGTYNGNQSGLDIRTASNYIVLSDGDGNPRGIFDSSGNLLINSTAFAVNAARLQAVATGTSYGAMFINDNSGYQTVGFWNKATSGTIYLAEFATGTTYASRGSITYNGAVVSYNSTSDYRLKNTIAPMTGALAKVALLKPCTYKWNSNGLDGEGFIAHELAEVFPSAVAGEKDAVDADGNPKYQGIDTSFLVATLTAAIQELKAEFDAYKASHP